jgi:hypothetical protein
MTVTDDLRLLLEQRPGASAKELQQLVESLGRPKPTRSEVNGALYRGETFRNDGGSPPRWYVTGDAAAQPAEAMSSRRRRPAAVRSGSDLSMGPDPEPVPPPARPLIDAMSKKELVTAICAEIGVADVGIGPGSTEPKAVFTSIVDRLELPLDRSLSKTGLAEAIARRAGLSWGSSMDSRETPSGGGDTVTADGLRQVLRAIWLIKEGASTAPVDHERPVMPPTLAPSYGLVPAAPSGGGEGTAGGEGPVHAALKEFVKNDPQAAVGEPLTYLAEDLVEPSAQRLGDEITFVTGDRVDLLMRDREGRIVVIEIEPDIGPSGHIGFHQAAKYWVLVALANDLPLDQVRRVVVARRIDGALRHSYEAKYGIESFEVRLPEAEIR